MKEVTYKVFISTDVNGEQLRFTVHYEATSQQHALEQAAAEWKFPEYYMLSAKISEGCN